MWKDKPWFGPLSEEFYLEGWPGGVSAEEIRKYTRELGPAQPRERPAGGWDHATGEPIDGEGGERG